MPRIESDSGVIKFLKVFFAIVGTIAFWVMLYYVGIYDGGCAHPICPKEGF